MDVYKLAKKSGKTTVWKKNTEEKQGVENVKLSSGIKKWWCNQQNWPNGYTGEGKPDG